MLMSTDKIDLLLVHYFVMTPVPGDGQAASLTLFSLSLGLQQAGEIV